MSTRNGSIICTGPLWFSEVKLSNGGSIVRVTLPSGWDTIGTPKSTRNFRHFEGQKDSLIEIKDGASSISGSLGEMNLKCPPLAELVLHGFRPLVVKKRGSRLLLVGHK